jgi:hypothetical protein
MSNPNLPQVSSDRVMEILQRDPLGAALLRAAIAEATVEVCQRRIEELERPSADSANEPAHALRPAEQAQF